MGTKRMLSALTRNSRWPLVLCPSREVTSHVHVPRQGTSPMFLTRREKLPRSERKRMPLLVARTKPKAARPYYPAFNLEPPTTPSKPKEIDPAKRQQLEILTRQKKRELRFAHLREAVWISCVATEIAFLVFYFSH